jgi:hypothetical protein
MKKRTVVLSAVLLSLYGCASTNVFNETEAGSEYVRFNADEFQGVEYKNVKHTGQLDSEEYSLYVGEGGQAEFIYMEATKMDISLEYNHHQSERIHRLINTWNYNKGHDKQWGKTRRVNTPIGEVYFKPYRLTEKNQHCSGLSLEQDYAPDDPQQRPVKVIFGYLCVNGETDLSDQRIVSYIKQISLRDAYRGYEIASNMGHLKGPDAPLHINENKNYAELVRNGFVPGTGNEKFPFKRSFFYSIGGGGDNG